MLRIFCQTAEHCVNNAICSGFLENLPGVILKYTDWNYTCQQTENGCTLMPTFHKMPYRNAFVPEIDIAVSVREEHTILHISGQPVKFVRSFMAVWFSFLFMLEIFLLVLAAASKHNNVFPIFIPVGMCVFGYLLCKLATKATFHSVVEAIQREYG